MKRVSLAMAFAIALTTQTTLQAQEEAPYVITFTRSHWNMDYKDFSMEKWKALESEYHEKVIMKNEFIAASNVLLHYYTPDNSEIMFVQAYRSWGDVEKATQKNAELAKAAWPDEAERRAFFDKQSEYYAMKHSDEIYSSLSLAKPLTEKPTEPMVVYMRTTHRAWPEDGAADALRSMRKEYIENVVHKNDMVKGYYPMRHLYGADSREIIEVFVMNSMAELEETNKKKIGELVNAHWPDEAKRKEFFDAYNKYRSPWHGDLLYTSIPELAK
jgi:siroheme synthase (precorrin-2 oxidase/ferrochelatase)